MVTRVHSESWAEETCGEAALSPLEIKSAGKFDVTGFPEDGHFDFAWVGERLFDGGGEIAAESGGLAIIDATGVDDDANFATGLNGEGMFDAWETAGEGFEFFETSDIFFESFAASAGARSRDGIGSGNEDGVDMFGANIVVVSGGGVDNFAAFTVAFQEFCTDCGVSAFHFVVCGFADVVEETAAPGECAIETELFGHHAGEVGDFDGVLTDILAVADSEVKSSHEVHEFRVQSANAGFFAGLKSETSDVFFHFAGGFDDNFLDSRGMDASILNESDE